MTLRNVALVAKREYLEIVRTKVFLIMTLLTPFLIVTWATLPSLMMMKKTNASRNLVIASADAELAERLAARLAGGIRVEDSRAKATTAKRATPTEVKYTASTTSDVSEENRKGLLRKIDAREIDGFLWLDAEAIEKRTVTYTARQTSDFVETQELERVLSDVLIRRDLTAAGVAPEKIDNTLRRVRLDAVQWQEGQAKRTNIFAQFLLPFILGFAMFMIVLLYGMGVMRAVLEEKTNRVMEVMMSTLNATELMAGKVLGVGAAGLTQVSVWVAMTGLVAALGIATAAGSLLKESPLDLSLGLYFVVFFLLGFLLYSTMCAAIGAMVNTEREAQQIQQFAMLPLIVSFMIMMFAIRAPNDPMVTVASFVPFCSPLLMFMRIMVQKPPLWQIALSITLLIAGILATFWIAGRIYRVGVLMYGKRPTLPEIIKRIRHA